MTNLSKSLLGDELLPPDIECNTYSIHEIKKHYKKLNTNLIEVMERFKDILLSDSFDERDRKYLLARDCSFKEYKLLDKDIRDHGENIMRNILEVSFEESIEHSIDFFDSPNYKDWFYEMEILKNKILKIDSDTTDLLVIVKRLYETLYKIYDSFTPIYIKRLKIRYEKVVNSPDFNFAAICNKLTLEPDINKRKNGFYQAISEKDMLSLKLGFEPDNYIPNVYFKDNCLKAIQILENQIKNTNENYIPETNDDNSELESDDQTKNKEFTTKRQVLAMYYMWNELDKNINSIDRTVRARFIQFLTGKNKSNIYKALAEPHKGLENDKNNKSAIKDLEFVKHYFDSIGLKSIVEKISNDMQ